MRMFFFSRVLSDNYTQGWNVGCVRTVECTVYTVQCTQHVHSVPLRRFEFLDRYNMVKSRAKLTKLTNI